MTRITHNSVFAAHRLKCRISISRSTSGIFLFRVSLLKNLAATFVKCCRDFMRGFIIRSISPEEVQALKCLRAVEGYLDLGLFEEADEELRALDPAWFALPHTLSLQLRVFAGLSEHE
jgi:hypothetical protein